MTDTDAVFIRRLKLNNYKAFRNFELRFRGDSFLVGPNNAGKSTLIEAMKGAAAMLRHASKRRPDFHRFDKGSFVWAYRSPAERHEIEGENLRHDFRSADSSRPRTLGRDCPDCGVAGSG